MTALRNVLIISPYFPPSTLAGVHRARHLAKHLPAAGWHPIVLCVDERYHTQRLDPELATLVPSDVEIIKISAVPARLSRMLGVGDISLRAWGSLKGAIDVLLAERMIHAVLMTGSPFYPMLFAGVFRRAGIPVVVDFQDPWVSDWGAAQPWASKAGLAHKLSTLLEPRVLRHASYITSVSVTQNAQMAARYPFLAQDRMAAIPIGGDAADFDQWRREGVAAPDQGARTGKVSLVYVGSYWPAAEPVLMRIFESVATFRQTHPSASRLRLLFIGTDPGLGPASHERVSSLAAHYSLSDIVEERAARLPYVDALRAMSAADALLLIGSDEPHYTASKIYPALLSGRPYLSLYHRESSAHHILEKANGGVSLAFSNAQELSCLTGALVDGLHRLVDERQSFSPPDLTVISPYLASSVAKAYAAIFDFLHGERQAPATVAHAYDDANPCV